MCGISGEARFGGAAADPRAVARMTEALQDRGPDGGALQHLRGPLLDLVTEALSSPAAESRGLFRPEYVDELRRRPDEHRTPTGYHKLSQLGLLELWLQAQGIG